jgi:two-component system response regulator AlgR
MLKILIIDDEAPARNRLRRMLSDVPAVSVVGEAATGQEALRVIPSLNPDVLLLDISMPGLDGMKLAKMLRLKSVVPAIIFCTAWSDQAVEAFECEAVDYLVKPVRAERLEQALDKARRFLGSADGGTDGPFLRSSLGGKVNLIPMSEVIYLCAEDKYTTVIYEKGETVISQSLTDLENEHPDILIRAHRGTLLVKTRIRGLEKDADGRHLLQLDGCERRPQVSRRNLPAIRKLIRELT